MKCPNCNGVMTCGCQRRKLPNGKIGCSNCEKSFYADKNKVAKEDNNTKNNNT